MMKVELLYQSMPVEIVLQLVRLGMMEMDQNAGHVRIYEWDGTSWTQMGLDIEGEAADDYSGSVSINSVGDRVAIGARSNDGNGPDAGHVRIYEWDGTSWTQMGLDIDGEAAGDFSGYSVSINAGGDRVAIGAYQNDGNGLGAGHVRIYEWDGTSWTQMGLDIDGEAAGDYSGESLSINAIGDRIAIGAYRNDGNGSNAGHVRIYEWDGTSWTQMGLDIDGEAADDNSGFSVSINSVGDRVAIGARSNDGNGPDAGHVRIYEWDGTSWTQMGLDIDGEAADDNSGYSVSINASGDRVAIGAPNNYLNYGHIRIYEWDGAGWNQMGIDITGTEIDAYFGETVSLSSSGSILAGAAPYYIYGVYQGQVTTFSLEYPICLISVDITSTKNVVVWEKPQFAGLDSVRIYREFGTGNYGLVGTVSNDTLSQFTDNTFGVNPNITSYRYKIALVDSNGLQITAQSPFHETMHLSTNLAPNGDVNLIWDAYEGFPVTYYRILRDSTFTNNWQVLDSVSSNSFIWTDINPPSTGAQYIIEVVAPFTCTATKAVDHNTTRSNRDGIIGGGAAPSAYFTANNTQVNVGGVIDFFDQTINSPTTWFWNLPGGIPAFSTQQNPSAITYNTPGFYDVTLVVSNALGLDTLIKTGYIEVYTGSGLQPDCDFIASATQVLENIPVDFLDQTLNNPTSWIWLFPGGNPSFSMLQYPTDVIYNNTGIYDVTLIVSNPSGSDTLVKTNYITVSNTIGLQENKDQQIKLYPNPTNSTLTVELKQIELPCAITLKDIRGRVVFSTTANSKKLELDLSKYEKGIYLIGISSENFVKELKVIKK